MAGIWKNVGGTPKVPDSGGSSALSVTVAPSIGSFVQLSIINPLGSIKMKICPPNCI